MVMESMGKVLSERRASTLKVPESGFMASTQAETISSQFLSSS